MQFPAIIGMAVMTASAAALPTETFEFEDLTGSSQPDTITLIGSIIDVSLSVPSGGTLSGMSSVQNIPGTAPENWGARSLLVNGPLDGPAPYPLTITFGGGVTGFSIEYGDYGSTGDEIDTLTFQMFSGANGTGQLIETQTVVWSGGFSDSEPRRFDFSFLTPTTALGSVVIDSAGRNGAHSLYYDNLTVTVPAPTSLAAFGAATLTFRRRRDR